jgi:hypothetical protein
MCATFATLLLTTACSSEDAQPGTGGSSTTGSGGAGGETSAGGQGGTGGAGGGTGGAGGTVCAGHDAEAPAVEAVYVAEDIPKGIGGPVADGTYHLVEQRRYTGPGGMTGPAGAMWQETAIWSATEVKTVVDAFDGEGERRLGIAYDLGGGSGELSMSVVCPESLNLPWTEYSADHDTLTLYSTNPAASWHYELQIRP